MREPILIEIAYIARCFPPSIWWLLARLPWCLPHLAALAEKQTTAMCCTHIKLLGLHGAPICTVLVCRLPFMYIYSLHRTLCMCSSCKSLLQGAAIDGKVAFRIRTSAQMRLQQVIIESDVTD